jgi:spondin N
MLRSFRVISIIALFALIWSCEDNGGNLTGSSNGPELRRGVVQDGAVNINRRGVAEYEITFTNLTPATGPGASQPMSPPVLAAHTKFFHVFQKGAYASTEIAQIAEDAVSGPLVEALGNNVLVYNVAQGDGVVFPGASTTINIAASVGFRKLSIVSMLVNTNDAFAGLDAIHMPARGSKTVYLHAYDAGSEENTESFDHIPGPCCGSPHVRVPTNERITLHGGITGNGDLDAALYGWHGAVAKVTITRVN